MPTGVSLRDVSCPLIVRAVKRACVEACTQLPNDVLAALIEARDREPVGPACDVLEQLVENACIAKSEWIPICQDTGLTMVFVELGQDVHIADGFLYEAIDQGVRDGYEEGYLRKSIVRHPLNRVNTGDNTPAVIHIELVPGNSLRITVAPKGGGSENMSVALVLKPAEGTEGVKRFVVETVRNSGANPCPPVIVGIGLGGTLEKAAILSKKAILREVGQAANNSTDATLERELLSAVNETGVGPAGYGGQVTALAVHVESYPCHIASLPVAVTLQCHAARHVTVEL